MLPRDISQLIFNDLVSCHSLSDDSIEAFLDCALQVIDRKVCSMAAKSFYRMVFSLFCLMLTGHMPGRLSRSERHLDGCHLFTRIIFIFYSSF